MYPRRCKRRIGESSRAERAGSHIFDFHCLDIGYRARRPSGNKREKALVRLHGRESVMEVEIPTLNTR